MRMETIGCPETSVRNYHHSLHNNQEERNSQLLCGGSLQSRMNVRLCISTKRYSGEMVYKTCNITCEIQEIRRTQWSRGLRRESADFRLLGLLVRILPREWMFVCCECCMLSGRVICDGPIPRPEKSYWLCVCVSLLSVIRCNNIHIHQQWVGRIYQTKKEDTGCPNRSASLHTGTQ
jgi:hypothetical protein